MYAIGLQAMGLETVIAATAEDGFADACLFQPDVIVADLRLVRNVQLMRRLRADGRTSAAKLIVLTSQPSSAVQQSARAIGCDRYLVKPCLPDVLAHEVHALLGSPRGCSSSATSGDSRPADLGRAASFLE